MKKNIFKKFKKMFLLLALLSVNFAFGMENKNTDEKVTIDEKVKKVCVFLSLDKSIVIKLIADHALENASVEGIIGCYYNLEHKKLEVKSDKLILTNKNIQEIKVGEKDKCPICWDNLLEKQISYINNCGHVFCTGCIEQFIIPKQAEKSTETDVVEPTFIAGQFVPIKETIESKEIYNIETTKCPVCQGDIDRVCELKVKEKSEKKNKNILKRKFDQISNDKAEKGPKRKKKKIIEDDEENDLGVYGEDWFWGPMKKVFGIGKSKENYFAEDDFEYDYEKK